MGTEAEKQPKGPTPRVTLSLPIDTYERLSGAAQREYRTIGGQIRFMLDRLEQQEEGGRPCAG